MPSVPMVECIPIRSFQWQQCEARVIEAVLSVGGYILKTCRKVVEINRTGLGRAARACSHPTAALLEKEDTTEQDRYLNL